MSHLWRGMDVSHKYWWPALPKLHSQDHGKLCLKGTQMPEPVKSYLLTCPIPSDCLTDSNVMGKTLMLAKWALDPKTSWGHGRLFRTLHCHYCINLLHVFITAAMQLHKTKVNSVPTTTKNALFPKLSCHSTWELNILLLKADMWHSVKAYSAFVWCLLKEAVFYRMKARPIKITVTGHEWWSVLGRRPWKNPSGLI